MSNNNIEVIEGFAVFESPREVKVEEKILGARKWVLATGASPVIPEIPGLQEGLMTTDDLFDMDHMPDSVLVYGAGHVEVEMAALLNTFGAKVYLAFDSARILPREDGDTSQRIAKALREQGIEILSRSTLRSVQVSSQACNALLSADDDRTVSVERVLVCLRAPNTKDLGLEKAGVKLDESGFILVDENLQTSAEGIYAVGDVTGGRMLSYAATAMGVTAGENAMGKRGIFPAHLVPRGLYTIPEASAVGLSEEEAEAQGYDVETGLFPMSINGLALSYGEMEGVVKVVCDSAYGEILGVHIIGGRATELIWGAGLAMQLEATVDDLARMILVHPTFSESLAMAAQDAQGWALYLPKR